MGTFHRELERLTKMAPSANEPRAIEIPLSYLYLDEEDWDKHQTICRLMAWNNKSLVSHILEVWCSLYGGSTDQAMTAEQKAQRTLVTEAFQADATVRGYQSPADNDYYLAISAWDSNRFPLRPYQGGRRPDFSTHPLSTFAKPAQIKQNQRAIRSIKCSPYNAAVLRLLCEWGEDNAIVMLGKLVKWHYANHWNKGNYQWQIQAALQQTLFPDVDTPS